MGAKYWKYCYQISAQLEQDEAAIELENESDFFLERQSLLEKVRYSSKLGNTEKLRILTLRQIIKLMPRIKI